MVNPHNNMSDEVLMKLYQSDNSIAFDLLYGRYNQKIYSYLDKRLTNKNNINDIFQKVFLKLHKTRTSYDSKFLFVQWIYTITKSVLLDHLKQKELTTVELCDFHQTLITSNINNIDLDSEKQLSTKERKALIMRYYENHDFEDISIALNISKPNSRKIISRGLRKLKAKYVGGLNE